LDNDQQVPLFIGGVGRSGTTLVADLVGLHGSLSPVYETDFMVELLKSVRGKTIGQLKEALQFSLEWAKPLPHRPHNKREHENYHHGPHYVLFTKENMEEELGAFVKGLTTTNVPAKIELLASRLFDRHAALDGKRLWINKTPAYLIYLSELRQTFPRMKFVHCIRDGRDVACSVATRPWGPNTHIEAAGWWKSQIIDAAKTARAFPADFHNVRYEDLVRHPQPTLKRLFNFLEVEDESEALVKKYVEASDGISLSQAPIGTWKAKFTDEEKEKFWEQAGDLLSQLAYSKHDES
jgi:hypothetical protein